MSLAAIEQVKWYIYDTGAKLGVLSRYAGNHRVKLPSPSELDSLIEQLAAEDQAEALLRFRRADQARRGTVCSGSLVGVSVDAQEWGRLALEADDTLNVIKRRMTDGGPAEERTGDDPAVDAEDELILKALDEQAPRLMTQDQIEAAARVSRKTVGQRLKGLLQQDLAIQPKGPKGGTTITDKGKKLCERLASKPT